MNFLLSFLVVSMLFLFSCSTPKIMYDYDKTAKFSSYKTFDFYPEIQLYMNELDSSRIIQQVENAMLNLQTNQLQMAKMLREAEVDLQRNQRLERQRNFNQSSNDGRRGSTRAFS